MFCGKVWSAATCATDYQIIDLRAKKFGGGIVANINVRPEYRERYYALFVNGQFIATKYCDLLGQMNLAIPPGLGRFQSFFVEDIGNLADLPEDTIPLVAQHARKQDSLTANAFNIQWSISDYVQSTVYGDSQLSSISASGLSRANTEGIDLFPQRGRLFYSITSTGTTRIVRWWQGTTLIAEGYRTGNGVVTCSEINGSGVTITATITYTADIARGIAFLDFKWPAAYEIHYDTSPLVFPRTAQATVPDDGTGAIEYTYLIMNLDPDTYYWTVVPVDDEGNKLSTPQTPTDSPFVINGAPEKPVITSVTGNAAAITVNFTNGETGCTYKGYYSRVNGPINLGNMADGPTPIGPTAVNATSLTLAAIADYTPYDAEPDYDTFAAAVDSAVSTLNTAFDSGQMNYAGFSSDLDTTYNTLIAAFDTLTAASGFAFKSLRARLLLAKNTVKYIVDAIAADTEMTASWKNAIGAYYGDYLIYLGTMLESNPSRYTLPNGGLAGGLAGGETIGSTTSTQTGADTSLGTDISVKRALTPFVRPSLYRIVVRATKSGTEEENGDVYTLELDSTGAIVSFRPVKANVVSVTLQEEGTEAVVVGSVIEDDFLIAATHMDLYFTTTDPVVPGTTPVTQSVALPSAGINGLRQATFPTVTGLSNGWYNVVAVARVNGVISETFDVRRVHVSNDEPTSMPTLRGWVVRGRGR